MERIIIRTSDVAILYGITESEAIRNLKVIRDSFERKPKQKITIKEFAEYSGIAEVEILKKLKI